MANFSESFQFLQPIEIYNSSSQNKLVKNINSSWSVSLYRESLLQSAGVFPGYWKTCCKVKETFRKEGKDLLS